VAGSEGELSVKGARKVGGIPPSAYSSIDAALLRTTPVRVARPGMRPRSAMQVKCEPRLLRRFIANDVSSIVVCEVEERIGDIVLLEREEDQSGPAGLHVGA
jgi:hypothetical protein